MADGQQAHATITYGIQQPVVADAVLVQVRVQVLQATLAVAAPADGIRSDAPHGAGDAFLHVFGKSEQVVVERRFLNDVVAHGGRLPSPGENNSLAELLHETHNFFLVRKEAACAPHHDGPRGFAPAAAPSEPVVHTCTMWPRKDEVQSANASTALINAASALFCKLTSPVTRTTVAAGCSICSSRMLAMMRSSST